MGNQSEGEIGVAIDRKDLAIRQQGPSLFIIQIGLGRRARFGPSHRVQIQQSCLSESRYGRGFIEETSERALSMAVRRRSPL